MAKMLACAGSIIANWICALLAFDRTTTAVWTNSDGLTVNVRKLIPGNQ